jgi:hypothetical protein
MNIRPTDEGPDSFDRVPDGSRIGRAVGEKLAVRLSHERGTAADRMYVLGDAKLAEGNMDDAGELAMQRVPLAAAG